MNGFGSGPNGYPQTEQRSVSLSAIKRGPDSVWFSPRSAIFFSLTSRVVNSTLSLIVGALGEWVYRRFVFRDLSLRRPRWRSSPVDFKLPVGSSTGAGLRR
jgi:hypothetical protein